MTRGDGPPDQPPRVFTLPATVDFLDALVAGILDGRIIPGFAPRADPLSLADLTLYVPSRRGARALGEAFLSALGTRAAILPRILPLGDVEEDRLAIEVEPDQDTLASTGLTPAIAPFDRLLAMTRLVEGWAKVLSPAALQLLPSDTPAVPVSAADAAHLASDLLALMDQVTTEGASWDDLASLVPENLAGHWQITLAFLSIATSAWPELLTERGLMDPAVRRNALLLAEAARLAAHPGKPVIAAGSTGSIPATAELLSAIARLPKGAIVLPGLDQDLPDDAWAEIGPEAASHPQFGLKNLLTRMKIDRTAVRQLVAPPTPALGLRSRALSEAFRPAETTEGWGPAIAALARDPAGLDTAFAGVCLVEAATEREEAATIAAILAEAAQAGAGSAALVTPDRILARRVAVDLKRFGLEVDDSAGQPLGTTSAGILIRLVSDVAARPADAHVLLALLKHPLARFNRMAGDVTSAVRTLEMTVLRGPRIGGGLTEVQAALAAVRDRIAERGKVIQIGLVLYNAEAIAAAMALVETVAEALAPLTALGDLHLPQPAPDLAGPDGTDRPDDGPMPAADTRAAPGKADLPVPIATLARATADALAAIVADPEGSDAAFLENEAGAVAARVLADLANADDAGLAVPLSEWPGLLQVLIGETPVRRRGGPGRDRIAILGPLEARLQRPETVVLGGLNEGVWPAATRTDPWLSRTMRAAFGLEPPERRVGLSAHDVVQGLGAPRVILTRARRSGAAPTVASRFLKRIEAVLPPDLLTRMRADGNRLIAHAAHLDQPDGPPQPAKQPAPTPPVETRPQMLSITEIETLIRDPYAIYARHILKLAPLDPIGGEPDALVRGILLHAILAEFLALWRGPFDGRPAPARAPETKDATGPGRFDLSGLTAEAALIAIGRRHFAEYTLYPDVAALWWPRFLRIARAFVAHEAQKAGGIRTHLLEVSGKLEPVGPGLKFTLKGRADRLDILTDGKLQVIDYKTGAPPSNPQVNALLAPQLPLEAALARAGAFDDPTKKIEIAGCSIAGLSYVHLSGGDPPLSEEPRGTPQKKSDPPVDLDALADKAMTKLRGLVAGYARLEQGYLSRARLERERTFENPYDHLARVQEWSVSGGEDAE